MCNTGIIRKQIFIVGTPRSGTTLTAKILGKHSQIFMPGETHFFSDIYSMNSGKCGDDFNTNKDEAIHRLLTLYKRYNEPLDQQRVDGLIENENLRQQIEQNADSYESLLNIFMEAQMRHENKQRWGNNAPRDIFYLPEILSFYPDAKIIVCVRDIKDFLLSYKGKWKATTPEHVERLKKLYHPVVTSMLWKSSMKLIPKIIGMVPPNNFYLLKYEQLVTKPEQEIKNLCTMIEEYFEPAMLDIKFANSSAGTTGNGIFSSSVGRWKKDLPLEDAYIAQSITKKELYKLGYPEEKLESNLVKVVGKWMTSPLAFVRGLHANKDSRGPLLPYLYTRVKSIVS